MREDPDSWDLLTACLVACDLERLEETWSFLLSQRVVEDGRRQRLAYRSAVRTALEPGDDGATARLAEALRLRRVATARAAQTDARGRRAREQRQRFDSGQIAHPPVEPFPLPPFPPHFEATVDCHARPETWHCIYCGWRCADPHNDYRCTNCRSIRPFLGGEATMVECPACGGLSLAVASFCEWCAYDLD